MDDLILIVSRILVVNAVIAGEGDEVVFGCLIDGISDVETEFEAAHDEGDAGAELSAPLDVMISAMTIIITFVEADDGQTGGCDAVEVEIAVIEDVELEAERERYAVDIFGISEFSELIIILELDGEPAIWADFEVPSESRREAIFVVECFAFIIRVPFIIGLFVSEDSETEAESGADTLDGSGGFGGISGCFDDCRGRLSNDDDFSSVCVDATRDVAGCGTGRWRTITGSGAGVVTGSGAVRSCDERKIILCVDIECKT